MKNKYLVIALFLCSMYAITSCTNDVKKSLNSKAPQGMVWVEGKTFLQGAKQGDTYAMPLEKPAHRVTVDGFFIDITEVTNKQFKEFVEQTKYVTIAEREIDWEEIEAEMEENNAWRPSNRTDWDNIYVSLNEIAGGGNYRLAIKVSSGNSNNLYIDNLELFIQDIAQPTRIPENSFYIYPNPTQSLLNIVFSRNESESIKMTLFDLSGIPYFEQFYPNTLNQTYTLDLTTIPMGLYILQIEGQGFKEVKRIIKN